MPRQTVTSPCYSCIQKSCIDCKHELMRDWAVIKKNIPEENRDIFIENLYREITDIVFDPPADGTDQVLGQPFHGFPVGEFTQDDWLHFLDDHHSKGIGWIYENISPYEF